MISRLSGRTGQRDAGPEPSHVGTPLPPQAEHVIRQFFALIEKFRLPDSDGAPEVKASLKRRRKTGASRNATRESRGRKEARP